MVRVSVNLTPDQRQKIHRAVTRFVRNDVRILIVNCMQMRIVWRKVSGEAVLLVNPKDTKSDIALGVANLDCSVINLQKNDRLVVTSTVGRTGLENRQFGCALKEWAGPDVAVVLL